MIGEESLNPATDELFALYSSCIEGAEEMERDLFEAVGTYDAKHGGLSVEMGLVMYAYYARTGVEYL